ncbi:GNAT family N-acetyltransferase [Ktedonosporobacter rubrisoli]|uniref:GNAT family N-acetyltransferase n=1 Tax=Ktedonosporobacter rubrisoli TaxID=2509675 RepID=A0A4P6JI85_KTERU|nr:GNAT family N-acetyltransferase [Ktedonosporobacter rubrisoli]QBD74765.1 GNAT family N-acetyltransferase [Ktedonosporobacter rubrisoli]
MADAGIRKYREGDREAIQDICYLTGYMGNSAACYWRHKPSFVEIWTSYYIDHEPASLYVATIDNRVVGYLTGCLDTSSAPKLENIMTAQITKYGLLFRPGTAGFLYRALLDSLREKQGATGELLDERWPAHLHINLLPDARGTGLGRALMQRWFEHLRESGSPGCHLGTIVENTRAVTFFEKMGFKKYGDSPPIAGMRGPDGTRLHQQLMVWSA